MKDWFSFDDVLIEPKFSTIRSRKDVSTASKFLGLELTTPVISSNMDTVTGVDMAVAMHKNGGLGCLHRFYTIEENVKVFREVMLTHGRPVMVSVGLGDKELERAEALIDAGALWVVIDVAHGANIGVVEQYEALRGKYGSNVSIIVGNFATANSMRDFNSFSSHPLEAAKIGIGNGAACTTRIKTGVGVPHLSAIIDCGSMGIPIIADGGCKNAGDFAKAIAGGACAVMAGRMLAGCTESPSELRVKFAYGDLSAEEFKKDYPGTELTDVRNRLYKKYRGSASAESYGVQGKDATWRTAEGEAYTIPYTGPVANILQDINAGLRSAMSYVGARDITEFQARAEFLYCTTLSVAENGAHGKDRK